MQSILSVSNLTKAFPGVQALTRCQFDLRQGEVHALMGENGAGKSTLMKILAGIYQKDSGEIWFKGRSVSFTSPRAAQRMGIGIVHQELNLMQHLTVAQNISIGFEPRKFLGLWLDERQANQIAQNLFERMHLKLDPTALVSSLTVASQQLVEICKALRHQSEILIMDEPTAALNNVEIEDLFNVLRGLKKQGVAIIYISHRMDEIQRIADRVTVLRDGQYIDTVPATTCLDEIIKLMVGREIKYEVRSEAVQQQREIVLEARNLQRGRHIRNVSFQLRKGEIVGFAGLMGAGRTEVARSVFGADILDAGEIYVQGKRVQINTPADAVKLGIGYLSEDRKRFGVVTGMDVSANIAMSTMEQFLLGWVVLHLNKMKEVAQSMVERLKIKTPHIAQLVKFLSGGNQQKVVIAKWLTRNCSILFFDEPTRGIDVGAKSEIYQLIKSLADQGDTIVVISSELPEVLHLCERILVMCEGRITGEILAKDATQEKIMQLATQRQ